ncbi:replication initiation protein [Aliarcobacter butzleri]|uniref:replication initiation protein n=1 Tax=Aliarcobacter TaxID=2321111 RepID=UPI0021B4A9FB|nr:MULTISPECIES: replication initiation protein [Aliarcobacter]MCT7535808.1 replication initiation protein [Aliarcobacter cryaerophilus]MCT7612435.1 replication initiation protein [Aliarcobacter butzleri]MCT7641077.1 replication initiation protein [Aliarcobacter butzleri]MDS1371453.1 replication initiation protein [Aliarcobacter butzleri]
MRKDNLMTKQQLIAEEQKRLFKNRKVVQLNKFIKGDVSPFTVNDLKIFKLIISKVDSKDSLFQDFYEITTDEIRHLNINEKHLYSETKKSLKRLANIYITFEENDSFREVGLIRNDFRFDKYSKKILINFNDDMGEYLINLKKNFFMYDLIDIVNFKYKHTLKLYEYFKSNSLNVVKLKVDTIKDILDLKNKYIRYTNFKKDVIEVIIDEINSSSNTLYLKYSEEKVGPKVEYIIFHVTRIKNDAILEGKLSENRLYSNLYGKECNYLGKYYTIENINLENLLIVLKEQYSNNHTNIVSESKEKLEEQLKKLLPNDFKKKNIDEIEIDEIERLSAIKDFRLFKSKVVEQFKGKVVGNHMPGFDKEVLLKLEEDSGYLFDTSVGKIITKEESLEVWKYLYKNKDKVGLVVEDKVENEVYKYINKIIFITKKDSFGNKESIKYIVTDIKEEADNKGLIKYRLHINNLEDPTQDVEKSKTLLTFEQIKLFIEENSVEKNYSLHNE